MHLPGPRKRPLRVHVLHVKGSDDRLPSQLVAERKKLSGSSVYWGQHLALSTPPVHDESFYYGVVMSCTPRAPLYLVHLVHTPLPVGCSLRKRRPGAETKGTLPPMPLEIFLILGGFGVKCVLICKDVTGASSSKRSRRCHRKNFLSGTVQYRRGSNQLAIKKHTTTLLCRIDFTSPATDRSD